MKKQFKKIVITVFLSGFFVVNAYAQHLKGKLFAGGSGGFGFTPTSANINGIDYNNPKSYQAYNTDLSGGYCLTDKLAVGLQISHSFKTYKSIYFEYQNNIIVNQITHTTTTTKTFGIAPLLRYTIPVTDKFSFNLNIIVPYFSSKTFYVSSINGYVSSVAYQGAGNIYLPYGNNNPIAAASYGINISPGFQWFLKKNFALSGSFGALRYSYTITKSSEIADPITTNGIAVTAKSTDFKLSLSSSLNLGLTFYFGSNKSLN